MTADERLTGPNLAARFRLPALIALLVPSPDGSTRLDAGDLVVAMGDDEVLASLTA